MTDYLTQANCLDQLNSAENMEKYKTAGKIVASVLDSLVKDVKAGTSSCELCCTGDMLIAEEVEKVYRKKKLEHGKGIAFPTCVSVNEVAGYFRPTKDNDRILEMGDLVKIELGVHIDGFPAYVCYTVGISNAENPLTGDRAKALTAVSEASKAMLGVLKAEKHNTDIVKTMEKYADKYDCNLMLTDNAEKLCPGVCSYQMSQNVLDGENDDWSDDIHSVILHRESEDYEFNLRKEELFENEVYAIDIAMSTGSGKLRESEEPTNVFKRTKNAYSLKMKNSRTVLQAFNRSKFPVTTESITELPKTRVKFGLVECQNHGLLQPYTVYKEKNGESIARAVFTVAVKQKKPVLITGRAIDLSNTVVD